MINNENFIIPKNSEITSYFDGKKWEKIIPPFPKDAIEAFGNSSLCGRSPKWGWIEKCNLIKKYFTMLKRIIEEQKENRPFLLAFHKLQQKQKTTYALSLEHCWPTHWNIVGAHLDVHPGDATLDVRLRLAKSVVLL